MNVSRWDLDHPEIPVLALWNAAAEADASGVPSL